MGIKKAALVLALCGAPLAASAAPRSVDVVVSSGEAHLTFADYSSGIRLDLKPFTSADAVDKAEILFESTENRLSYVVLRITGPSVLGGGSGYCGAGEEENLVWMKISSTALLDVRAVRNRSCVFSIEPETFELTGDGLKTDFTDYTENKKFTLLYDGKSPEEGFTVSSADGRR